MSSRSSSSDYQSKRMKSISNHSSTTPMSSSREKRKEPSSTNSTSNNNKAAFTYSEDDGGKSLTKKQIKKNLIQDQSKALWYNRDLSDKTIAEFTIGILISRGKVEPEIAQTLLNPKGISLMKRAFTHWSIPDEYNYELLETLGDTTYNKAVTYLLRRRFPELNNDPNGNYKLSEASKLYKSKLKAPIFSDDLGLFRMARYRSLIYQPQPDTFPKKINQLCMDNKMKTDLFEAFIAAIEDLIDENLYQNLGYAIAYNIIESLFENIELTINLSETKTNKAKLKELIDRLHGNMEYRKKYTSGNDIIGVDLYLVFDSPLLSLDETSYKNKQFSSAGTSKGFDICADEVSRFALEWLDKTCGRKWTL